MTDYIVSQNFGNANSIVVRMNNFMGFPSASVKTDRYAIPQEHATNPGEYLIPIKTVGAPAIQTRLDPTLPIGIATVEDIRGELNPTERNAIKSRETLELEGAFPVPDIP